MRSPFPSYRERYLPAFTLEKIRSFPDKARTPVILPTGAIEQHGPHLPVAVDAFLGQYWVSRLCAALPSDIPALIAPPITVGKSNEHSGFPGTLSISKHTLRSQVLAIGSQLHAWGFRSLLVLNTHGGNTAVLAYTLRELAGLPGMRAEFLRADARLDISPQEAAYGFHANEVETALLYALAPQHTRPDAARCHYPARLDEPGDLKPENAPATFAWVSLDISPHGVMGDASAATAEKGRVWAERLVESHVAAVVRHVRDLASH